jgi:hypothetical protein
MNLIQSNGITIKFNINNNVSVKLTRAGINHFYEHHERFGIITDGPQIDEHGWHKTQLWSLMSIFGERMYLGAANMFSTDIILHQTEICDVIGD